MIKHFVLDTNVLLHNSSAIFSFADNTVVLPMTVIEELDQFKRNNDELGRNSRMVIRQLDRLRQQGRLGEGVRMDNGGILRITVAKEEMPGVCMDMNAPDNRILATAWNLHQRGETVIFVSKDINARLKADALGIAVMDFEKEKCDAERLFTGWRELTVSGDQIEAFHQRNQLEIPALPEDEVLLPNEFVLLRDGDKPKHSGMARVKGELLVRLNDSFDKPWNLSAHSKEQRMALELLLDPEVALVSLVGRAGTGKTLLALAAGLEATLKQRQYEKLLVSRPVIPLGRDIGFLPGSKDEKLTLWMQPIFDNLSYLMGIHRRRSDEGTAQQMVHRLLKNEEVELEALTYIRGRSISRQYVIIDEAQNLTPHEVKTIISRAGEGSKMVLTGDPAQIDNPYLDASSNGLSYAVERLKGQRVCGHVTLSKSERSELSSLAADYL